MPVLRQNPFLLRKKSSAVLSAHRAPEPTAGTFEKCTEDQILPAFSLPYFVPDILDNIMLVPVVFTSKKYSRGHIALL